MKRFNISVNGMTYEVEVEEVLEEKPQQKTAVVAPAPKQTPKPKPKQNVTQQVDGGVTALMPGMVSEILVSVGDSVYDGQPVLVLEAMKMENDIMANQDGVVKEILVQAGQTVAAGDLLVIIE